MIVPFEKTSSASAMTAEHQKEDNSGEGPQQPDKKEDCKTRKSNWEAYSGMNPNLTEEDLKEWAEHIGREG